NNWVFTYGSGVTYKVVIEVTTYVQLWNPHNLPLSGALTVHYQNSDQVNVIGTSLTFTSQPDATIIFHYTDTHPLNPDPHKPVKTNGGNAGLISGTPAPGSAGTYSVTISATNSSGTATATLVITVSP